MSLSITAMEMLIVFSPGILAVFVINLVDPLHEIKVHEWFIYTFLLGITVHVIVFCISPLISCFSPDYYPFLYHYDTKLNMYPSEIIYALLIGVLLGFVVGYCIDHQNIPKFLLKHGLSKAIHRPIFDKMMKDGIDNNSDENNHWIRIYDTTDRVYYDGYVYEWQNNGEDNAVLLTDVSVHDLDNGFLKYETPALYIPKALSDHIINFAYVKKTDFEKDD